MSHPRYPLQREESIATHDIIESYAHGEISMGAASIMVAENEATFKARRETEFPGWQAEYEAACLAWINVAPVQKKEATVSHCEHGTPFAYACEQCDAEDEKTNGERSQDA